MNSSLASYSMAVTSSSNRGQPSQHAANSAPHTPVGSGNGSTSSSAAGPAVQSGAANSEWSNNEANAGAAPASPASSTGTATTGQTAYQTTLSVSAEQPALASAPSTNPSTAGPVLTSNSISSSGTPAISGAVSTSRIGMSTSRSSLTVQLPSTSGPCSSLSVSVSTPPASTSVSYSESADLSHLECRSLISSQLCGAMIGRSGVNVKRVRNETGAHISITKQELHRDQVNQIRMQQQRLPALPSNWTPNLRILTVRGTIQQIVAATKQLVALMTEAAKNLQDGQNEKERENKSGTDRGSSSPRTPGRENEDSQLDEEADPSELDHRDNILSSVAAQQQIPSFVTSSMSAVAAANIVNVQSLPHLQGINANCEVFPSSSYSASVTNSLGGTPIITWRVLVHGSLIPSIIGTKGSVIKKTMYESNTRINVSDVQLPFSTDRMIFVHNLPPSGSNAGLHHKASQSNTPKHSNEQDQHLTPASSQSAVNNKYDPGVCISRAIEQLMLTIKKNPLPSSAKVAHYYPGFEMSGLPISHANTNANAAAVQAQHAHAHAQAQAVNMNLGLNLNPAMQVAGNPLGLSAHSKAALPTLTITVNPATLKSLPTPTQQAAQQNPFARALNPSGSPPLLPNPLAQQSAAASASTAANSVVGHPTVPALNLAAATVHAQALLAASAGGAAQQIHPHSAHTHSHAHAQALGQQQQAHQGSHSAHTAHPHAHSAASSAAAVAAHAAQLPSLMNLAQMQNYAAFGQHAHPALQQQSTAFLQFPQYQSNALNVNVNPFGQQQNAAAQLAPHAALQFPFGLQINPAAAAAAQMHLMQTHAHAPHQHLTPPTATGAANGQNGLFPSNDVSALLNDFNTQLALNNAAANASQQLGHQIAGSAPHSHNATPRREEEIQSAAAALQAALPLAFGQLPAAFTAYPNLLDDNAAALLYSSSAPTSTQPSPTARIVYSYIHRLPIPMAVVGALIGRRGAVISELRVRTRCSIAVRATDSSPTDRVVIIRAHTQDDLELGIRLVQATIDEAIAAKFGTLPQHSLAATGALSSRSTGSGISEYADDPGADDDLQHNYPLADEKNHGQA